MAIKYVLSLIHLIIFKCKELSMRMLPIYSDTTLISNHYHKSTESITYTKAIAMKKFFLYSGILYLVLIPYTWYFYHSTVLLVFNLIIGLLAITVSYTEGGSRI